MIIYLTFNDPPSGIFSSQVIDVVKFIRTELNENIRLVSLISLRSFWKQRRKIKNELPDAIVLPMFPGVHRWRNNSVLLKLLFLSLRARLIIGRSVLATQLAFRTKGEAKVVYDGRGAITAEWKEYGVVTNADLLAEIEELERGAIQESQWRIAVSEQLVKHWREQFNYTREDHVVIPCTLNAAFENLDLNPDKVGAARRALGLAPDDIVFMYSGSVSGWQSFKLLHKFIVPVLQSSSAHKLVFFSPSHANVLKLQQLFPQQVVCRLLSPRQVPDFLIAGDYGLLLREQSVTNRVASPVKFAEYLACGLSVIVSPALGDYSAFVEKEGCGYVLSTPIIGNISNLKIVMKKLEIRQRTMAHFTKRAFKTKYMQTTSL